MRRTRASLVTMVMAGVLAVGVASPAAAQNPGSAAADLRSNDVTFEPNALSQQQLNQLDAAAARAQQSGAYFKVVVLAEAVSGYSSTGAYADAVRRTLGGNGRVLVYTPNDVAIASNVDSKAEVLAAEQAARGAGNRTQSYAQGLIAAQQSLGAPSTGGSTGGGSTGGGTGSGVTAGGGSGAGILIFLLAVAAALAGLFWWMSRSRRKAKQKAETAQATEGELKVRERVDHAGKLVLDLADRVERPDAPPRAKELYQQGTTAFAGYQEELEEADTIPELETVYPKVVGAAWLLDSSKALLDGQPEPARPVAEVLFPATPPLAQPVGAPAGSTMIDPELLRPAPQRNYQGLSSSPWLTTAAAAALSMLAGRMGSQPTRHRPPARDDDVLGWGSGINLGGGSGGGGRGMGSRSGRRGMGRR